MPNKLAAIFLPSGRSVIDAAVFGLPNEEYGEEVFAVVQLDDEAKSHPEMLDALKALCREKLGSQKVPRGIDFVKELPHDANGKLLKHALRQEYSGSHAARRQSAVPSF